MTPTSPISIIPTPVIADPLLEDYGQGITFPADGSGLAFDPDYPVTFATDPPGDLARLFPTQLPEVEVTVYQRVREMCSRRSIFPSDGQGMPFPITFDVDADVPLPLDRNGDLPVLRGWPAYPGAVPAIGVTETSTSTDTSEDASQAGFVTDAYATDDLGNVTATCAYYAHPIHTTVVVELIHTNRDERDRLHSQLFYRVLQPLRRILPGTSPQIREVRVSSEKQDLPMDEQPIVVYVSVITVDVFGEALVPDEITLDGVIGEIYVTVDPQPASTPIPTQGPSRDPIDLT